MEAIQNKAYELVLKFDQNVRFPVRIRLNRLKRRILNFLNQLHMTADDAIFIFVIIPVMLMLAYVIDYVFNALF